MHRLRSKREHTICPCNSCKNNIAHEDNVVQSYLIRYGFIKNYIVWKFHGEVEDPSATGASGGNSSTTTVAVSVEQQPSAVADSGHGTATGDNADPDSITMDDLLKDMANNGTDVICPLCIAVGTLIS
jgi:hypothetical protein